METELERRIYSPWAFTENEREKAKINRSIYKELMSKYKVTIHFNPDKDNLDDYDIAIKHKPCYLHSETVVIKNEPKLSTIELALLTDDGNLCFGWSNEGRFIRVNED